MRRGFTILEVLAALMIFAGAAVALTTSYINVINAYAHVRTGLQGDEDMKLARAALFSQPDPALATQGDEFDVAEAGGSRHVVWSAELQYTDVADLFDVTLTTTVTRPGEQQPTTASETLRLLRPTWSDASQRTQIQQAARQKITELIASKQSQ